MRLKKSIIFLILFFSILILKNTPVLGVVLTEVEYNGITYKPDVAPLELQTNTDSYMIYISSDLTEINVIEPYNSDDYLVAYSDTSLSNGTYNRVKGYNLSSNSLTSVLIYTSTFSDSSWSGWSENSDTFISSYAPGSTASYLPVKKSNIALYSSALGIIGTEVISSGIPLPEGIKFTDNITIFSCDSTPYYYLFYSSNKENKFFEHYSCEYKMIDTSHAIVYFDYYKYNSSSKEFEYIGNVNKVTAKYNYNFKILYSYNSIVKKTSFTEYNYSYGDFFQFYYDYKNFPYIANTAEDLANGSSSNIVIFPGDFKNDEDITFTIYSVEERDLEDGSTYEYQNPVFSQTLNNTSTYYKSLDDDSEFWFEIPIDDYFSLLEKGTQYIFNISYSYNDKSYSNDIYATWGGLTQEDIDKNKQLEETIKQTEKIEEQTEAIKEQTEAIKEQTEVSKSIWGTLKEVLSYINPFSENFFVYKLIDLLIDMFISLFVPSNDFFSEWFSDLNEWLGERFGFLYYPFELVIDVLNRISALKFSDSFVLSFPDLKISLFGEESTLIKSFSYNFNDLVAVSPFDSIYDFYLIAVDVILILGLVILIKNTFVEIFGGKFADDVVHNLNSNSTTSSKNSNTSNSSKNNKK